MFCHLIRTMLQCEQVAESDLWSVTRPAAVRMLHVGKYSVDMSVWIADVPRYVDAWRSFIHFWHATLRVLGTRRRHQAPEWRQMHDGKFNFSLLVVWHFTFMMKFTEWWFECDDFRRLVLGLLFALFVWYLPTMRLRDGQFPAHFYILLFLSSALHQVSARLYHSTHTLVIVADCKKHRGRSVNQSTLGGLAWHICRKIYVWKINRMPSFYTIFAWKVFFPDFFWPGVAGWAANGKGLNEYVLLQIM